MNLEIDVDYIFWNICYSDMVSSSLFYRIPDAIEKEECLLILFCLINGANSGYDIRTIYYWLLMNNYEKYCDDIERINL